MKRNMKYLFACCLLIVSVHLQAQNENQGSSPFVVKPYLQIGQSPSASSLDLLWQTADENADWVVEVKNPGNKNWAPATKPGFTFISAKGISRRKAYTVHLTELAPGSIFNYHLSKNGKIIFTATAMAPKNPEQPYRFVVSGDIGAATPDAKLLSRQAFLAKPDLVMIPGDIVYEHGLISEYDTKFWPVYNADISNDSGAALMRSVPFVAAPGNHDTEEKDFDKYPGALAYFLFWDQPVNGPLQKEGGPSYPLLKISDSARKAFMETAGNRFPVMTNFSFNYGNAHWLVLDANPYVDWTDKALTDWIEKDLAAAAGATWRFVAFHHPGFSSSREHFEQQHMRLLSPLFEAGKVDIVFNGHVHNYQRSFPLRFVPDKKGTLLVGGKDNKTVRGRVVNGRWTLDKIFDGKTNTKSNGVIYIVTGAGGQELYNPEQNNDPDSWQKFTCKFISSTHSLTVVDINGKSLKLHQLDTNGKELDAIEITK
ncbi:MAG: metallophosphoesterase [Bacteroidota bacterium]|nr:metallophosphoesterase [Bacteroidota bacterium]